MLSDEEIQILASESGVGAETVRDIATQSGAGYDAVKRTLESMGFVDEAARPPSATEYQRALSARGITADTAQVQSLLDRLVNVTTEKQVFAFFEMHAAYTELTDMLRYEPVAPARCGFSTEYSEDQRGLQCGKHAMMALLKSESERASALSQLRCTENLREDEIVNAIRNVHGDKWENELNARLDVAIFSQVNSLGALPIILGMQDEMLREAFGNYEFKVRGVLINVGGHYIAIRREPGPYGLICLYKVDSGEDAGMRSTPDGMDAIIDYVARINNPVVLVVYEKGAESAFQMHHYYRRHAERIAFLPLYDGIKDTDSALSAYN